jgi:two-component system, cell cycle sensor histidine kinase and response regulator CckA
MPNPLRVLMVEDSEDDMLLTIRALRLGGYQLDYVRVETTDQMQVELDRQCWDIVIADYTLPAFSAPAALKLLQQRQQDLPFIIVSGTIGEETAVDAMRSGAHDYIIKGNLVRLIPAIERELREAQERAKRRTAEQALRESEQKIREQANLIDVVSDAIFVRDLDNQITFWNRGAERLYGWTTAEIVGQNADSLLDCGNFQTVIQKGEWQGESHRIDRQGQEVIVSTRCTLVRDEEGQPRSILTVDTDITEKKRLETQFLRAQRLESLGTLASGIAHDFNNILTPILAISQLLPMRLPDLDDRNQQMLRIIADNAKRGAELVKQIVVFARGGEGKRIPLQINHLLSEIVQMAHQTFPKTIAIQSNLHPNESWLVCGDGTQLHQVFMNLAVNARDAMPDGGVLSVGTERIVVDESFARRNLDAHPGAYLMIQVSDTGTGISPELMDRIFDPFFTTKDIGKGTGLGLSTILGIVRSHEGFVKVCSEVGNGSQFKVYLPIIQQPVTDNLEEAVPL